MTELEKFAMDNAAPVETTVDYGNKAEESLNKSKIFKFDSEIRGGMPVSTQSPASIFRQILAGEDSEIKFVTPVGVGILDNILFVVDSGARVVFKYDLETQQVTALGNVGAQFVGEPGKIYVSKDRTFYVVDSTGKQVLQFSEDGQRLNTFQDLANLARPMDVFVDELKNEVYVADGSYSHIVVFDQFGSIKRAIGKRGVGPGRFRAITAMTRGFEGIYVVDRLELPVQVINEAGDFKYSFGETEHVFPLAIAVSVDQRVFVSDKSDNKIRVYQNGELLAVVGGTGSAKGRFREITSMAIKDNKLYIADSQNKRVQVLQILPPENPIMPTPLKL